MPNHDKPIEECDVWDILDWDTVAALSSEATGDPHDNPLAWCAKKLIDNASKTIGRDDENTLHRIASNWIGSGKADVRRQKAGILAVRLGAKPDRFIGYAAFKWGLFKVNTRV